MRERETFTYLGSNTNKQSGIDIGVRELIGKAAGAFPYKKYHSNTIEWY